MSSYTITEDDKSSSSNSIIRSALTEGFTSLAAFDKKPGLSIVLPNPDPDICRAKVNFIDPAGNRPHHDSPSYFHLIDNIFRRDYNHTLRNIPYQNIRSGALSTIESIQISCVKTESAPSGTRSSFVSSSNQNSNNSSSNTNNAISLLFGRNRASDVGSKVPNSSSSTINNNASSSTNSNAITSSQDTVTATSDTTATATSTAISNNSAEITVSTPTPAPKALATPNITHRSNSDPFPKPITQPKRLSNSDNNISDATSWHVGQYCHVYIAACESAEHYRTKVRPSLQAFISQIDSNYKNSNSNTPMIVGPSGPINPTIPQGSTSLTSSQYVIVYVPIQQQNSSSSSQLGVSGVATGLRARAAASLAAHRAATAARTSAYPLPDHLNGGNTIDYMMDSSHSSSVHHTSIHLGDATGNGNLTADLSLLSNKEKEVYRKISYDFPQGRISVLSTLTLTDGAGGGTGMSIMTPAQTATHQQEWSLFMRNLGSAIIAGFWDRFGQYDDQLRHLDKRRALASTTVGSSLKKKMDLTHYFLVKESLAFSYEQMQLHSEALLQYKEFSVVIPTALWNGGSPTSVINNEDLSDAALGNTSTFRSKIRYNQVTEIELYHYIFCREIHLLFKMHKPVDVIARTHQHILFLDSMQRMSQSEPDLIIRAQVEASALSACWDVKRACDKYFSFSTNLHPDKMKSVGGSRMSGGMSTVRNMVSGIARGTVVAEKERDASQKLSSLLEFARLRMRVLGEIMFTKNPIRLTGLERPVWVPWEGLTHRIKRSNSTHFVKCDVNHDHSNGADNLNKSHSSPNLVENKNENEKDDHIVPSPPKVDVTKIRAVVESEWLRDCFQSQTSYETKYLQLSGAIITLYQHAGFPRFATRLLTERAEIYILRKDYESAARILSKIVDSTPLRDQLWDKIYFWRLFRLACCQRMSLCPPISYLKTLVRCFTSRLARVTPHETAILFQRDLEALIKEESVRECSLSISPLFEIELLVTPTNNLSRSTYSQHPLGFLRKKLTKYTCMVGEVMTIVVSITSSLPKSVTLDRLRLFLVTYENYENAYHRSNDGRNKYHGVNIIESDAYRILPLRGDILIKPGRNEFKFDWIPMTVGHFALASMDMQWSNAAFFHDSSTFRRPIQGIEVVPSEPTQTIELNPLFLIPGHEQEIRLVFSSGKDIITKGSADFICSDGLKILVPGADPTDEKSWRKSCIVGIEPCEPGSTRLIKTLVRSAVVSAETDYGRKMGGVQTIKANIQTSFHHNLYNKLTESGDEEPKSPPMTTELDIMVTTLDRPALTVFKASAVAISDKQVIVSVTLHCNTPLPFFIKEWDVTFPPPLMLEADGDLNEGLFGNPVAVGEEIFFGFSCSRSKGGHGIDDGNNVGGNSKPTLHVTLQDEIGKTFHQVLPLDLNEFYEKMEKRDEFAGMNTVKASLVCCSDEGVVGAPAHFTFNVDITNLSVLEERTLTSVNEEQSTTWNKTLLYSISCDENYWILAGRVQGIVERKVNEDGTVYFSLEFVGIPTRAGLLTSFPKINVLYKSMPPATTVTPKDFSIPPIFAQCDFPESFRSLPYTNHMALATATVEGSTSQT